MDKCARPVRVLKKKNKKEVAQEERERLNDRFAANSTNENNSKLALMHSFTGTYALKNKQASSPPFLSQERLWTSEEIFISDSSSSNEYSDYRTDGVEHDERGLSHLKHPIQIPSIQESGYGGPKLTLAAN